MIVETDSLVVFDPVTRRLYGPGEYTLSQNGMAMQITLQSDPQETMAMRIFQDAPAVTPEEKKRTRRTTKNDRIMSRALEEANAKAKKKSGGFRKGWNQKKLMIEAHRLRRKYSK